jgi:hypothetical protein
MRDNPLINRLQLGRDPSTAQQILAWLDAETLYIQGRAGLIGSARANGMNAPDKTPQPFQRIWVVQFRGTAAAARKYRKTKTLVAMQRGARAIDHRGDNRNFLRIQFGHKGVFFENRGIAPALRPIKLGDERHAFFHADLVNTVFVAIERQQPAVAPETDAIQRIEDEIWRERRERMLRFSAHARVKFRTSRIRLDG